MSKVRYYRPPEMLPLTREAFRKSIEEILGTRQFTKGLFVEKLEQEFKDRFNNPCVLATSSGTTALYIAAKTLADVANFKTVEIPAFTYVSTRMAFEMAGFKILVRDIDSETFFIRPKVHADVVCGVDTFGSRWDPDPDWLDETTFMIDAAQSLGTKEVGSCVNGREIECISLTGSKIFTTGEGGLIAFKSENDYEYAKGIRDWAGRMSELQALLGLAYISQLGEIIMLRRQVARMWRNMFKEVQWQEIPAATNYYAIAGLVSNREHFLSALSKIEFKLYWADPQVDLYRWYPMSSFVAKRIVCFPVTASLTQSEVERVLEV